MRISRHTPIFAIVAAPMLLAGCVSAGIQTPTLTATISTQDDYKEVYSNEELRHTIQLPQLFRHPLPVDMRQMSNEATDSVKRNTAQDMLLLRSDQVCTAYQTRMIHAFVVGGLVSRLSIALSK